MTLVEKMKAKMKIKWLLKHTDLQKQLIAKLVGVNNSTVTHHLEDFSKKHRKQRSLSKEEMDNYLDYCEYLEQLVDELMGV